jgi:short subunit dehydrogenase-like uncharacterized protein
MDDVILQAGPDKGTTNSLADLRTESNMSKPLIVFGATSFVGQILCRYLHELNLEAQAGGGSVNWLMAARSEEKLKLRALCEEASVIISTVGPYALYGEPLIKACVESGTDYCDLTGGNPVDPAHDRPL